jgi:pimeloyl-ACP methyl ester carboxylesterase
MPTDFTPYAPRRAARSLRLPLRGLDHHVLEWGDASLATPAKPSLLLLHGWMDVGASFQFVVDALADLEGPVRHVLAADWRGFGLTTGPAVDSYWFPDYLGDLDALLARLAPERPVDLLGHSMGGNVVMAYAGVRPARVRRLMNLEGFGLPASTPADAPRKLAQWLDELAAPATLRDYASADEVAARLRKTNPRLPADKAAWLARHWARPAADGRWRVLGDPAHKRTNPVPYRADEVVQTWRAITAPLLWVEGAATEMERWWGGRYPRAEFERRLAVVPDCRRVRLADAGHMLHHDQPEALARALLDFLA